MHKEPIAIIGMSCRFPQAKNLNEFWQLLLEGRDVVTEVPATRWNVEDYYDPDPTVAGKTQQRHAALLENVFDFDPLFFNISPAEATEMNPSQKLMLELAWEAMEHSGVPYKKLEGGNVGVFIGNIWSDFEHLRRQRNSPATTHSAIGQSANIIANRVSYSFGFRGPSLVVDTGCSSALVALHLACQSLWDGSAELSITGGVNHILDPELYGVLSKFGGLSAKGRCSAFDSSADGFVRGEGAGVLLLKRLSDAERDGDRIHAVIRGSAINNNGFNVNLPATSVEGQVEVLEEAYRVAGVAPLDVHFVETHGTGTKVGDPTEAKALGAVLGKGRTDDRRLLIGSVKTNIGHMEGAAGIAGMLKVILAMQHGLIPKNLHFNNPNPDIPFDELKVKVPVENTPWPAGQGETLKAGVNSFGWGGTNAHVVLEEYRRPQAIASANEGIRREAYVLPISAKSESALKEYARSYARYLREEINGALKDFHRTCIATALVKPELDYRLALVGAQKADVIARLEEFANDTNPVLPAGKMKGGSRIAFVFPGQGSQWLGMGRELYAKEKVFRETIDACDRIFSHYTDWSLIDELHATSADSRFSEINVIQPTISAVQMALAALWRSWGVEPDAVVGHSMGEVAAAYTAGAISLEDAAKVICLRSKLMRRLSGKGGGMAVTELKVEEAEKIVQRYPNQLSVAVNNSPKSTVIAGDIDAIEEVLAELESRNLFCRKVKVDVASHSQQMDPLRDELREVLQSVSPRQASVRMYSTVRNQVMEGTELTADYWVDNLRNTVLFAAVMEKLLKDKHTIFIEVSPHPVLTTAVNECIEQQGAEAAVIPSLRREKPEEEEMVGNLAELYRQGYSVNWTAFYGTQHAPHVGLPAYPWQRERYEIEDRSGEYEGGGQGSSRHPLLGQYVALAGEGNVHHWQIRVNTDKLPYLEDYRVEGALVLPEAFYLEAISAATEELYGRAGYELRDVHVHRAFRLVEKQTATLQLQLRVAPDNRISFQYHGQPAEGGAWTLLADGHVHIGAKTTHSPEAQYLTDLDFATAAPATAGQLYQRLQQTGLTYGEHLQMADRCWRHGNETLLQLTPGERILQSAGRYRLHPAFTQACLQGLFAGIWLEGEGKKIAIQSVGAYQVLAGLDAAQPIWVKVVRHAHVERSAQSDYTVKADLLAYTAELKPVFRLLNVVLKVSDRQADGKEQLKDWLYGIQWRARETGAETKPARSEGTWVIFGDAIGVSQSLEQKLRAAGQEVVRVPAEALYKNGTTQLNPSFTEVLTKVSAEGRKLAGIVHASSLGYEGIGPDVTADDLDAAQVAGSISLSYVLQSLEKLKLRENPRLFVLTNGVQCIGTEINANNYVQMPLWGFAKVAGNELSQYDCRRVDLSFVPTEEEITVLAKELLSTDKSEVEIAIRGKNQYVSRLARQTQVAPATEEITLRSDATYLITGFRGLGFVFLEWMFERGGRHFVLLSRSGQAPADVMQKIEGLRSQGAHIAIVKADTNDYAALKSVFDTIDAQMPPLKGVIHAAGLVDPKTITETDAANYYHITGPKVRGGWNLHLLTQHRSIDWFVLFSSVSTLFGVSGQASYVAANAFLDGLAHYRRRHGLPALSINWGAIKDVGMLADQADIERYARAEGLEAILMRDAMRVFGKVCGQGHAQLGILRLYMEQVLEYYGVLAQSNYLSELTGKAATATTVTTEAAIISTLQALSTVPERIKALEKYLIGEVARVIKSTASRINHGMTFKGLGIDSLMAVQLRNTLEKGVAVKLSVTSFWTNPTIREYAAFLYEQLGLEQTSETAAPDPVAPVSITAAKPQDSGKDLNAMSLDELAQELDDLLN